VTSYLFFPTADKAQDSIWQYSYETWGEKQAVKYIKGMHCHLQLLSEKKKVWRIVPSHLVVPSDLSLEIYFTKYEYHYLFFRELSAGKSAFWQFCMKKRIFLCVFAIIYEGSKNNNQDMKAGHRELLKPQRPPLRAVYSIFLKALRITYVSASD